MASGDDSAPFVVQPDAPPPTDAGIPCWPFGSYAPMGFYRPVPIVHFTGLVVTQFVLGVLLLSLLQGAPGIFSVGACALLSALLARRASARWLPLASAAWRVATFAALTFGLLFFVFVALARGCGPERLGPALEQAPVARSAAREGCRPAPAELLAEPDDNRR